MCKQTRNTHGLMQLYVVSSKFHYLWDSIFQINVVINIFVNNPQVKLITKLGLKYFVKFFKNFLKFEVE